MLTPLAQLGRLVLTEFEIDRAFVANMLTNTSDRTTVNTVIELGHNFGLAVVPDGVETDEILSAVGHEFLRPCARLGAEAGARAQRGYKSAWLVTTACVLQRSNARQIGQRRRIRRCYKAVG